MATEAQIAANRRNARKSTGPRTPEGKARSSRNHIIHGLAATSLLPSEDPAELEALHAELREEFQPAGMCEEIIVGRMALQRYPSDADDEDFDDEDGQCRPFDQPTTNYGAFSRRINFLTIYEACREHSFERFLRELQRLQAERRKRAAGAANSQPRSAAPRSPACETAPVPPEIGFECPPGPAVPALPARTLTVQRFSASPV